MPDLIPFMVRTVGDDTVNTVNARDLYAYLSLSGDYSLWIKRALKRANLVEDIDFIIYYQVVENSGRGRPAVETHLTFDAAKQVAMMSSATKGHEVRLWFIQKEKELAALQHGRPAAVDQFPELKAIVELAESVAKTRLELQQMSMRVEQANTKADLALEDAQRRTLEEFIGKNGLLRQFPRHSFQAYGKWLTDFCREHGLVVQKSQVYNQSWSHENAYPLAALTAWLRHETRKPRQAQLSVIVKKDDGA